MFCVILTFDLENHIQHDLDLKSSGKQWFWFFFIANHFLQHDFDFDSKSFQKWSYPTLLAGTHIAIGSSTKDIRPKCSRVPVKVLHTLVGMS